MPNKFTAPEMYRHILNGRAWVKSTNGWRAISTVTIVAVSKIERLKYPLHYRVPNGSRSVTEETEVSVYEETKYWPMADIIIYSGYDLNKAS